jgi:hypothetical protein
MDENEKRNGWMKMREKRIDENEKRNEWMKNEEKKDG